MKQYLTPEQTAKLIELGLEKPRLLYFGNNTIGNYAYTISELIEMLPTDNNIGWNIRKHNNITDISKTQYSVIVDVNMFLSAYTAESEELIDALYGMIIKLKKERVI